MSRASSWVLVALFVIFAAIASLMAHLTIDVPPILPLIWASTLGIGCILRRCGTARMRLALCDASEGLVQISLIGSAALVLSYATAKYSGDYADQLLADLDRSIGFDWVRWYMLLSPGSAADMALRYAYLSFFTLPPLVISWLCLADKSDRARALIGVYIFALIITLMIFPFLPGRSAQLYLVGNANHLMPATGLEHPQIIDALKTGRLSVVDLGHPIGLISFPSFHAVAGTVFIWAGWSVKPLRIVSTFLAVAMIVATPIHGSHYLVDVIAGIVLGMATALAWDRKLIRVPLERESTLSGSPGLVPQPSLKTSSI